MESLFEQVASPVAKEVLAGGGEMGALMRSLDWSTTPLGSVENWPQSLRTAVSICLASYFPMLIWWGPELVMLYNDAYRPMLGMTKHPKAMGQRGRECWPEIWDIIGPMLEGVLTKGEATRSENQLLLLDRNGYLEECYFTFSYSPIRDETGGVGGVFTAVTETTQQEIAQLYRQALEAITARDELFSIVSHDLKNPLATIKGFAQLLQRAVSRSNISDNAQILEEGLKRIDITATKMTTLINELMDIAFLQMDKPLNLNLHRTDLVTLTHQAVIECQQTSERHKFRIKTRVAELIGYWDATRLERVIANLLSNAIKYSPDGGTITVKLAREDSKDASWAILTVQDQGIGIPTSDLPYIFDRFRRAGNVAGQIKGIGIGLASARQIVERHGGKITVKSKEGAGSLFTVRLPPAPPNDTADSQGL